MKPEPFNVLLKYSGLGIFLIVLLGLHLPVSSDTGKCEAVVAWTNRVSLTPINVYTPEQGMCRYDGFGEGWTMARLLGFDKRSGTWVCVAARKSNLSSYYVVTSREGKVESIQLADLSDSSMLRSAVLKNGFVYVPSYMDDVLSVHIYGLDGKLRRIIKLSVPEKGIPDIDCDSVRFTVANNGFMAVEFTLANDTTAIYLFDACGKLKNKVGYCGYGEESQIDSLGTRIAYIGVYSRNGSADASGSSSLRTGPRIYCLETGKDYELSGFPPVVEAKTKYAVTPMELNWSPDGMCLFIRLQRQTGEYRLYCVSVAGEPIWKEFIPEEVGNSDWQILDTLPPGLQVASKSNAK